MGALTWDDGTGKTSNDTNLGVHFELRPKQNQAATLLHGRPVFDDVEYVEIFSPGDPKNIVCKPVTDEHRRRFAPQYAAFKLGQQAARSGTPLAQWPSITRAQVEELAFLKLSTVEELAAFPDTDKPGFEAVFELRKRARDYLEAAKGNAPLEQLRAQVESLSRQLAAQRAAQSAPGTEETAPAAQEKRGRGRPPGKKAAQDTTKEAAP